jgi:hypothetical protein
LKPEIVAAVRAGAVNLVEDLLAEELRLMKQNRDDWRTLCFRLSDNEAALAKRVKELEAELRNAPEG